MSRTMSDYEDIDFMSDSLSFLGDDMLERVNDGEVRYGELVLRIAPKASSHFAVSLADDVEHDLTSG